MRHLIRASLVALIVGLFAGVVSAATTAAQLIELSRAGLGDDILIALIQTDGSVFELSAPDILALHRAGLSDKVIRAMQETARKPAPLPSEQSASGDENRVEHVQTVQPPAPAVVHVYQTVTQKVESPRTNSYPAYGYPAYSIPVAVPVYIPRSVQPRPAAPVYWGFGGQRRPDSWDDRPTTRVDDPRPTERKKGGGN